MTDQEQQHRELFRLVARTLIAHAADLVGKSGGQFAATDVARALMSAGIVTMANSIGKAPTTEYVAALATALARGDEQSVLN